MDEALFYPNTKYNWEQIEGMMADLILSHKETERMFKETDKKFRETDRQFKETDKKFQESDLKLQKSWEKIDKLSALYGGVSENSKDVAEEFFFRGLENRKELFGIEYEYIDSMTRHKGKLQGQYDIVLYNGDKIIVIEVKYKLHPNDVDVFYNRKLPNFRALYPEFNHKKVIGAVAALSVPADSIAKALGYGFLVLTQSGNDLSVVNQSDFEPKTY